jgi:hypothetical protein
MLFIMYAEAPPPKAGAYMAGIKNGHVRVPRNRTANDRHEKLFGLS